MFIHNVDLRKLKHLSTILQISSIFALNFWKLSSWYCSLQCRTHLVQSELEEILLAKSEAPSLTQMMCLQ